ncbi:MAG: preprotein translocase subunit SecG [Pseudoxanthomonas sp.]
MMLILNVVFVLVAVAIIALVLMQRGAGAQAGSGFGSGASGTVFGARGASNFLSKSTKWLAVAFFAIALFMGWRAAHSARPVQQNLGLMAEPAQPAVPKAAGELAAPAASSTVPTVEAPAAQPPQAEQTAPAQEK